MTFRMYIFFMSLATLLSWVAWAIIVWNTNPLETGIGGFVIFYVTLLMGLVGMITLMGLSYRVIVLKRSSVISREVRISFRHGVALAAMAVIALALSAKDLLNWWIMLILVAAVSVLEYIFLIKEESRRL